MRLGKVSKRAVARMERIKEPDGVKSEEEKMNRETQLLTSNSAGLGERRGVKPVSSTAATSLGLKRSSIANGSTQFAVLQSVQRYRTGMR